jgi:hypothetical protein
MREISVRSEVMDFHLDYKLKLISNPENKNLYSWAIIEVDDNDDAVCREQIPWEWSSYFTANQIILSDQIEVIEGDEESILTLHEKSEINQLRSIRAKLTPGTPKNDGVGFNETTYRMFGAERDITNFFLDIYPLETESDTESCAALGSVSYTSDLDLEVMTSEDCIFFTLLVKPSTFEHYARRISDGSADEVILRVGRVEGFYSQWSMFPSTHSVKVLTRGDAQEVPIPADSRIAPLRLGRVGEAIVYINAIRGQPDKQVYSNDEASNSQLQSIPSAPSDRLDCPMKDNLQILESLQSLKWSIRWVVGLLVLLVISALIKL